MKNTKRVLAFLVGAAMMLPMASAEGKLASGNYEANAQGFGGAVTVKVTVTDGKVTAATITGDKETETIGGAAIKTLTEKLIGVSSADEVDAVRRQAKRRRKLPWWMACIPARNAVST